jgi:hypothetical protein
MSPEVRNILVYVATAILPPVADGVYQYLQAQSIAGKPIDWGQVAMVALLALLASYINATRPKAGHAEQAALIDAVGHTTATTVLTDTAAAQISGTQMTPFSAEQVRQIVDALHEPVSNELEARMQATPAETGSVA